MSPSQAILSLLRHRGAGRTICPSEAARLLSDEGAWRDRMPAVHRAVAELAGSGTVRLSWKGTMKPRPDGPYRIALA